MTPRKFRNPFKPTKRRRALDRSEWETFAVTERASGKPDRTPKVPRAFLRRMSKASIEGSGLESYRRPEWIARIVKAKGSTAPALDELAARTLKEPSEENLRGARLILNDVGRRPRGGRLIRRKLTQELVSELTRRSK